MKKWRWKRAAKFEPLDLAKGCFMKMAISSQGKRRDSQVEPWFGRAAYFLIADTGSMTFDAIENEAAGDSADIDEINAARLVINAGVRAVLTGNCGLDARHMFATAGVKLFQGVPGTVEEAVMQYKDGKLIEVSAPGIREPVEAGVSEG
jgi:predicted Fe-Mo cluster-binding NifX family protein